MRADAWSLGSAPPETLLHVELCELEADRARGEAHADPWAAHAARWGRTNAEIGKALFMSPKTASVHVSRILTKLNVRSRTEAAAVAYRHGLVGSGPPGGE
jgi:hypothetical protein